MSKTAIPFRAAELNITDMKIYGHEIYYGQFLIGAYVKTFSVKDNEDVYKFTPVKPPCMEEDDFEKFKTLCDVEWKSLTATCCVALAWAHEQLRQGWVD